MASITENHTREQYFWDSQTVTFLADILASFDRPCCLCTPTVGAELLRRQRPVTILDIDERFAELPGFQVWDLLKPSVVQKDFDVLLVDPPFFNVSLTRLFKSLRLLCRFDPSRKILVAWLKRRESALLSRFESFTLRPTGIKLGYETVVSCGKNDIELYANWDLALSN
ncbi:MAG: hypothetical protein P1V97_34950 [Planctomycetota bacterium]|nr:hypothetical protein [Planctomycetota bacterium]